uniref:Uncharacterized protein n=1 Tax=Arundo donax TaxID=35708 RepID=A0A0A9DPS8_ARUDO
MHRSMRKRRRSAVKRNHGVLNAAAPQRCRSSLSRQWSSSLGHGAPPPRISSNYSPPVAWDHHQKTVSQTTEEEMETEMKTKRKISTRPAPMEEEANCSIRHGEL